MENFVNFVVLNRFVRRNLTFYIFKIIMMRASLSNHCLLAVDEVVIEVLKCFNEECEALS